LYLGTDDTTTNISLYHVLDNSFGGETENSINWNNQVCGVSFDNSSACNLTPIDTIVSTGVGYKCFNLSSMARSFDEGEEIIMSFALKTPEISNLNVDVFNSFESGVNTPILNITHEVLTDLDVINDDVLLVGENNLVQANYTVCSTGESVVNATCVFSSVLGVGNMTYNDTLGLHEIYVIPEISGLFNFEINCSADNVQEQYQNSSVLTYFFAGELSSFTLYMWLDKNATTPFIDEFSYILLKLEDDVYNCTNITGFEGCWLGEEYNGGVANFTLFTSGNVSMYYYSGLLYFGGDLYPPTPANFNDFAFLGSYIVGDGGYDRIDLLVDEFELNFWSGITSFASTWGLLIFGFVVALALAVGVFWVSGKNIAVGFMVFVLTLWFLMAMGIIPDISDGLSLILS
jgi:hypothetical protein